MHCRHQKVRVNPAGQGDRYRDISIHQSRGRQVHRKLLSLARPACGERRRALRLFRRLKPNRDEYRLAGDEQTGHTRYRPAHAPRPSALAMAELLDWSPCQTRAQLPHPASAGAEVGSAML